MIQHADDPTTPPLPAVFLGHGSPTNALERNRFTKAWARLGTSLPRPRAVLVISAHWYGRFSAVTAMARPRTIHDFNGFPPPLSTFQYPAPGSPELAAEVAELVKPTRVNLDADSWGLDHGTWSVLCHVFPRADVPVVQLSIDAGLSFDQHVALGAALEPLRRRGVLILGSGNVVHNLRMVAWRDPDAEFDWNRRFDQAARTAMAKDPSAVAGLRVHRDYAMAVPTPDHFIPLLYVAGVAVAASASGDVLVSGPSMGSLSMTSFVVR